MSKKKLTGKELARIGKRVAKLGMQDYDEERNPIWKAYLKSKVYAFARGVPSIWHGYEQGWKDALKWRVRK